MYACSKIPEVRLSEVVEARQGAATQTHTAIVGDPKTSKNMHETD